jgi:hypothetical protein
MHLRRWVSEYRKPLCRMLLQVWLFLERRLDDMNFQALFEDRSLVAQTREAVYFPP